MSTPNARAKTNTVKLSRDGRGNYKRDLGWEADGASGFRQHRFYLGRDHADACLRAIKLEQLWDAAVRRWHRRPRGERPLWDSVSLAVALAVSRAEPVCLLDPAQHFHDRVDEAARVYHAELHDGQALLQWFRGLEADYGPVIPLKLHLDEGETALLEQGVEKTLRQADAFGRMAREAEALLAPAGGQTLHQALDAYAAAAARTYARQHGRRVCLALSRRLPVWVGKDGQVEARTEATPDGPNVPYMR